MMIWLIKIVHVTRTIRQEGASDAPDLYAPIIADYRAAMTQLKCAASERVLRLGISMAQLHILYTLQRNGEMTMTRLADVLNVSLSSATGLVDRIVERGFVERSHPPEDRRLVRIRVTPEGTRMLEEIDAVSDDLLRVVLGRLGRPQLAGVRQALADLRVALDTAMAQPAATAPAMDRHRVSTPAPRSASTIGPVLAPALGSIQPTTSTQKD
jgi:DNA-binding MarR family transcriptional regulator